MTTATIVKENGIQSFLELNNAMNNAVSDEKALVMAEATMKILYRKIKSQNLAVEDNVKDKYLGVSGNYAGTPIIIDNEIPFGEVCVYAK